MGEIEQEKRAQDLRAVMIIGVLLIGALVLAYLPTAIGALFPDAAPSNDVQRAATDS
jgi:hypothetical protein